MARRRPGPRPLRPGAARRRCSRHRRRDAADPVERAVVAELNPEGLRPSIETTLHALLPHRIVVHTHSVRTIALAIRTDGEAQSPSGWPASTGPRCPTQAGPAAHAAVAERLASGRSTSSCSAITVWSWVRRASRPPTAAARGRATARGTGARGAGWRSRCARAGCGRLGLRVVKHERAHTVATDRQQTLRATAGSLYPDHVIFLGPAAATLPGEALRRQQALHPARCGRAALARHHAQRRRARLVPGPRPRARARGCRSALPRRSQTWPICSTGTRRNTARAWPGPGAESGRGASRAWKLLGLQRLKEAAAPGDDVVGAHGRHHPGMPLLPLLQ